MHVVRFLDFSCKDNDLIQVIKSSLSRIGFERLPFNNMIKTSHSFQDNPFSSIHSSLKTVLR